MDEELTIYSDFALRHITLPKGYSPKTALDIPKTTDTNSIIVYQASEICSFDFIDPNNKVTVIKAHKDGSSTKYTGKLLQLRDNIVIIETNNKVLTINNYTLIEQQVLYPQLQLHCKGDNISLSYMLTGFSWTAQYNIYVDKTTISFIYLVGIVKNTTDTIFNLKKLHLMAGNIPRQRISSSSATYSQRSLLPMAAPRSMEADEQVQMYQVNEYKKYMANNVILDSTKHVPLSSWQNTKASKNYYNIIGQNSVSFEYIFTAPEFFPSGPANIYNNTDTSFIGGTTIRETQKHDEIRLSMGSTSEIKVKSTVEVKTTKIKQSSPTAKSTTGDEYELEETAQSVEKHVSIISYISNNTDTTITLYLQYYIGNSALSSMSHFERKQSTSSSAVKYVESGVRNGYFELKLLVPSSEAFLQTNFNFILTV